MPDLLARIDEWGRRTPDRPAHLSGSRICTYGELVARSNALAAHLAASLGDDPSPVAVLGHKEPEMLIAFLAAAKSGRPYVPLDTSLPSQRVARIVETSGARICLTPARVNELSAASAGASPRPVRGDEAYYIIFTSGSTGEPKGVVITLENLTGFVEWMLEEQGLTGPGEIFLNQAPFSFDLSVMDLYLSLVSGGTLFSISADEIANPRRLYQAFASSNVTTWVSTPSFAQMCLAEKTFTHAMLPEVRRFLFCGETLTPQVAGQLLQRFPSAQVWNTYGPTEATVATTSVRIDGDILARYSPLPVGYPRPGTRILLEDEAGRAVPPGERGEIVIAGSNVSPGYLGRADLTARSFSQRDGLRAYRTGDAGRSRDGMLFFEGRQDQQIKLHGYRIELGDVEANLCALPDVRDAVVVPLLKQGQPDSLIAFVSLAARRAASDFDQSLALRRQLAERLPAYMIPHRFLLLDAFPLTPNGKADRRKLAEMLE